MKRQPVCAEGWAQPCAQGCSELCCRVVPLHCSLSNQHYGDITLVIMGVGVREAQHTWWEPQVAVSEPGLASRSVGKGARCKGWYGEAWGWRVQASGGVCGGSVRRRKGEGCHWPREVMSLQPLHKTPVRPVPRGPHLRPLSGEQLLGIFMINLIDLFLNDHLQKEDR